MHTRSRRSVPALILTSSVLLLGAHAGPAAAQAARTGGGNQQLVQQLQQLASERTTLQTENARLKKELAEMTKERDTLKTTGRAAQDQRARASEAALARSAQEKANTESELERQKERMQELVARFRETAQTLRDVEIERTNFKQSLTTRESEITACVKKNDALYELNKEVLARLEGTGPFSRLASAEPFTKLKRTQLENLVDDYRYRAEDQKVSSSPATAPPATP